MSKRILMISLLIVLVVIGAVGYYYYQEQQTATRVSAASRQMTSITRGTLVATVSGAGNLYAPQQTNLNFQLTGVPITKVNVQVGDQVKAGTVLASVDDSDLQFALRNAQSNLTSAQAKLAALKLPPLDTDVAAARAQIASAQATYNAAVAKNNHAPDQLMSAKATLDKAAAALQQAQAAYDAISWRDNAGNSTQAANLAAATADYQSALANYNLAIVGINDTEVQSAAQQLASAQASLAKLTQPPLATDLTQAQASIDSAQVAIDQAKRNLAQAQIVAPFDGTVAAVNYVPGQLAPSGSSTAVVTLVNMNNLQTQITVSEVDIAKVKSGQTVDLSFDALGSKTYPGKIIAISPVGTVTQGVVNYTVTVTLDKADPGTLPGMTATANIIVAQHDNVLLVPNRAVKAQGNQHLLTIMYEGNEVQVRVQTGLSNDTNTEIVSATAMDGTAINLAEGDVVILNATTTTAGNARTTGGINPLGGLGGIGR